MNVAVEAFRAIQEGSRWALPLLFGAGIVSSIGPCAAPRIVALSSLILRSRRPMHTAIAFLAGTLGIYALIGTCAGSVIARLNAASSLLYYAMALAAIIGGVVTVGRAHWRPCGHTAPEAREGASIGVAFAAGAAFALVVSPCCTPMFGLILSVSGMGGSAVYTAAMAVTFGLGHAAAVLLSCLAGRPLFKWLPRSQFAQGAQVVAGTLLLAMGAYYAILA